MSTAAIITVIVWIIVGIIGLLIAVVLITLLGFCLVKIFDYIRDQL